jgi:alanyl-tRNA synthetase
LVEIERICNDFINQNYPVYSQEVPLHIAKTINGLRAVFGEVYPDPVRVVSVKYPIADLLKNTSSPQWTDTSIEFCGGT